MVKLAKSTLVFLILLDLVLFVVACFFPAFWGKVMHGTDAFVDPFFLMRRLGAVWFAFLLLQTIALVRFDKEPLWLIVVAGVRWTELFGDWVYWASAPSLTWFGHAGLLSSPPSNLWFGILMFRAYKELTKKA